MDLINLHTKKVHFDHNYKGINANLPKSSFSDFFEYSRTFFWKKTGVAAATPATLLPTALHPFIRNECELCLWISYKGLIWTILRWNNRQQTQVLVYWIGVHQVTLNCNSTCLGMLKRQCRTYQWERGRYDAGWGVPWNSLQNTLQIYLFLFCLFYNYFS